jgi:hypothetical protein
LPELPVLPRSPKFGEPVERKNFLCATKKLLAFVFYSCYKMISPAMPGWLFQGYLQALLFLSLVFFKVLCF